MTDLLSLPYQAALPQVVHSTVIVMIAIAALGGAVWTWKAALSISVMCDLALLVSSGISERDALGKLAATARPPVRGRLNKLLAEMAIRSDEELDSAVRQPGMRWPAQRKSNDR